MTKPAYFIIDVKIHNPEGMKPYAEKVAETYQAFGGKRIVYGAKAEALEGTVPEGQIVILQFDSIEKAKAWHDSPEYQAIIDYRLAASEGNAYLVQGIAG